MKFHISGLVICILFISSVQAQNVQPINSGDIIRKGVSLHDEKKYKEAVELYRQIPRNDTNYALARYEMAFSLSLDSNYKDALIACSEGLQAGDESQELPLLGLQASIVDDQGETQRALNMYDSVLQKYPNAQSLILNKAVTLMRLEKLDQAESLLQKLLVINPYYASAHYRLGLCALEKGNVVPAALSLFTCLTVNPSGSYARPAIQLLDRISKVTDDVRDLVNKRTENPTGNFAAIEQILLSKIALDKNYKIETALDDPIIRQLQVIMEKLEIGDSKDFYSQYYVPYLTDLFHKKLFEPAVYHALSDVSLEPIQRYMKKNTRDVKEANSLAVNYLDRIRFTRELDYNKRQDMPFTYHYSEGVLVARGTIEKNDLVGTCEFYYPNGNLKSVGTYNKDGKKEGKWIYYAVNGRLLGVDNWKNGVQEGEDIIYNANNLVVSKAMYQNGKLNGTKTSFFAVGHPFSVSQYQDGHQQGSYVDYYARGFKKTEAHLEEDKLQGPYKTYFENGKLQESASYEKGKLQGVYKSFYDNGQLEFEASYENGEINGTAKTYHPNGKPLRTANYVNGLLEGDEIKYNEDGVPEQKTNYKKGKAEGIAEYFDDDGKQYSTFEFVHDKLVTARYFDKTGKEISSSTRQGKSFELTTYNAEGFKRTSATYDQNDQKQKVQTFYYNSGGVEETDDYKDGMLEGFSTGYYPDGTKEYEVHYEKDKKQGLSKYYYPDGTLKSEGWYNEDELNGDYIEYNERGKITSRSTYVNGDLSGIRETYLANGKLNEEEKYMGGWLQKVMEYDTLGKVKQTITLTNGTGDYKGIFPNGKVRYAGKMVNGYLQGPYTIYFFDESASVKKNYDHGLLDGNYTDYYYGGQVNSEGKYVKGKQEGVWKSYYPDGVLSREEIYVNGELNGKCKYYYTDGKLEREIEYRNNVKNGSYVRFANDGQIAYTMTYKDNVPVSFSYNDKAGKPVTPIAIRGGNGKVVTYFSNGNKSAEMEFQDGKLKGNYVLYFPDGKIYYQDSKLIYGLSTDKISENYANGQKRYVYGYYMDNQDGPYQEFYENGRLKEEGSFYLGYPHGIRSMYDKTGKLVEKRTYYYGLLLNVTK